MRLCPRHRLPHRHLAAAVVVVVAVQVVAVQVAAVQVQVQVAVRVRVRVQLVVLVLLPPRCTMPPHRRHRQPKRHPHRCGGNSATAGCSGRSA